MTAIATQRTFPGDYEQTPDEPPTEVQPAGVFGDLNGYLKRFGPELGDRARSALTCLYDPEREPLSPEVQQLFQGAMAPYPAQAACVEGLVRVLRSKRVAFLCGEMGTGKTPMAAWTAAAVAAMGAVARATDWQRVILTAPNQLVNKWANHARKILPGAKVVIVTHFRQLEHLVGAARPTQHEVYILSRDRGKLSYSWRLGVKRDTAHEYVLTTVTDRRTGEDRPVRQRVARDSFRCPKCGTEQTMETAGATLPATRDHFLTARGNLRSKRVCQGHLSVLVRTSRDGEGNVVGDWKRVPCGEQLWQANNGDAPGARTPAGKGHMPSVRAPFDCGLVKTKVAPRRVAPAEYIARRKLNFTLYIADEMHELKGDGTLQGQMFALLAKRSDRVLGMTGTLVGGYATNLLHILWRTMPARLLADGLGHNETGFNSFVTAYGVKQTTSVYERANESQGYRDLVLGRGKLRSRREKVLPGISPVLFSKFLMGRTVFIRLQQMHDHLPPYDEFIHTIPLTRAQAACLASMTSAFKAHVMALKRRGEFSRAWSAAQACFLRWCDRPWPKYTVMDSTEYGVRFPAFDVPELPQDPEYPKMRRLRRLIQLQKARGRKVWVYTELTGEVWDVAAHWAAYLERYGIRCAVLRSVAGGGPPPEDREQWIADNTAGVDCVISHPGLVKTGLDLYAFPTLVFGYTGYDTYTLRQAARRAWRLGQTEPCEVHFLVYNKVDPFDRSPFPPGVGENMDLGYDAPVLDRSETGEDEEEEPAATKPTSDEFTAVKMTKYVSVQSAALALMANKMASALALEGDFSAEGLAAMSGGTDVQSQLARIIAGTLQAGDPKAEFAAYRERMRKCMPNIGRDFAAAPPAPTPVPAADPGPAVIAGLLRTATPTTAAELAAGLEKIQAPKAPRVRKPRPAAAAPAPEVRAEPVAPAPADPIPTAAAEPESVADRKNARLQALCLAIKAAPDESRGDLHRFGSCWYHLVGKHRRTFRDRNLAGLRAAGGADLRIAFAEPPLEVAVTASYREVSVGGVAYRVSAVTLADWDKSERVPNTAALEN